GFSSNREPAVVTQGKQREWNQGHHCECRQCKASDSTVEHLLTHPTIIPDLTDALTRIATLRDCPSESVTIDAMHNSWRSGFNVVVGTAQRTFPTVGSCVSGGIE